MAGPDVYQLDIRTDLEYLTPARWYTTINHVVFQSALPSGWNGDTARVIVTMPGIVLVNEDTRITDSTVKLFLDARAMNQLANNFDYQKGIADTITVTFFAEGTLKGEKAQAAGTLVIRGARVPKAPEKGLSE